MTELDDTIDGAGADGGPAGVPTASAGEDPDVAGGDAGGEIARRIRAVLRHGLDDGSAPS